MSNWYREYLAKIEAATKNQLDESVWLIDDGFMKHTHDIDGLSAYLRQHGIMPKDGILLNSRDFEAAEEDPEMRERRFGHHPLYGYFINLEERGQFYADVRDERGESVYEIKNDEEEQDGGFEDDGGDLPDDMAEW